MAYNGMKAEDDEVQTEGMVGRMPTVRTGEGEGRDFFEEDRSSEDVSRKWRKNQGSPARATNLLLFTAIQPHPDDDGREDELPRVIHSAHPEDGKERRRTQKERSAPSQSGEEPTAKPREEVREGRETDSELQKEKDLERQLEELKRKRKEREET